MAVAVFAGRAVFDVVTLFFTVVLVAALAPTLAAITITKEAVSNEPSFLPCGRKQRANDD
jgi:hypothetical protein